GFVPATFDHIGIVDNCSSCHDAGYATAKSSTHLATTQDCSVCHTTRAFTPANFDHTGIVDNCVSCHNGTTAIGTEAKTNPDHIATSLDCYACHTTATFAGGSWTHDATSDGRCSDCHSDGGGATFKPVDHLQTDVQCDTCHVTTGWAPTNFSHDPQGNYPGDHRRDPGCTGCHGPSVNAVFTYPSERYAPFCAGCHERDFERKGDHIGGENGTVEQNKDCSNGGRGCHRVSDRNFD
ncbi:MAG: cytochrome c3 family protein, partial [Pseudomonadales bacterium]|nr:cytochrome c3 family protein [Pseudomonadales bacterium]